MLTKNSTVSHKHAWIPIRVSVLTLPDKPDGSPPPCMAICFGYYKCKCGEESMLERRFDKSEAGFYMSYVRSFPVDDY